MGPIMWMLLLAFVVVPALFYLLIKSCSYWTDREVKQGTVIWVIIDSCKTFFRLQSFAERIDSAYKQFPGTRYSGSYQFSLPTLVVRDPDLLKQLTVKDFDHFTDHRPLISEEVDPITSNILFFLKGQRWHEMRTILSPSFTSSKMRTMFVLMVECAENFVQHFLKKDEDIVTLEMKDTYTRLTNDVIATCAFGIKVDSLGEPNNQFYLMGKEATYFGLWRLLKFFGYLIAPKLFRLLKVQLFTRKLTAFFEDLVNETITAREERGIVRPDMIHLLMEARKGINEHEDNGIIDTGFSTALESDLVKSKGKDAKDMTNKDIAAQALLFFFAGFETVSTLMSFMSYELTVNPEIQERLRKEILTTLKESDGKITYEGLLKMKYMDMVVSESLRKWPSAVVVDRSCTKPYTIQPAVPGEKPLHMEKGSLFWLPIYGMHRSPEHYPDPERFDPERFSEENRDNIKPYTYFPFGLGPRNCIGSRFALLETKTIFFHLLQHFQLVPVEKTQIPLKISKTSFNLTAERGFWIGLKRISGMATA